MAIYQYECDYCEESAKFETDDTPPETMDLVRLCPSRNGEDECCVHRKQS